MIESRRKPKTETMIVQGTGKVKEGKGSLRNFDVDRWIDKANADKYETTKKVAFTIDRNSEEKFLKLSLVWGLNQSEALARLIDESTEHIDEIKLFKRFYYPAHSVMKTKVFLASSFTTGNIDSLRLELVVPNKSYLVRLLIAYFADKMDSG